MKDMELREYLRLSGRIEAILASRSESVADRTALYYHQLYERWLAVGDTIFDGVLEKTRKWNIIGIRFCIFEKLQSASDDLTRGLSDNDAKLCRSASRDITHCLEMLDRYPQGRRGRPKTVPEPDTALSGIRGVSAVLA